MRIGSWIDNDDRLSSYVYCFFFQAEDGIRDISV